MIDPESNRILELARSARTPSDSDKAAVERRLAATLGLWAGASAATAAAATGSKAGASKLAGAAALKWLLPGAALIGAGAVGYVALLSPAAEPIAARSTQGRVPAARIEPAPVVAPANPQPVPAPALVPERAAVESAPEIAPPARSDRARTAPRGAQTAELDLLHRAQSAWRAGQARAALGLLDRHRARFARSALRSERDALRALCLCDVGRHAEAAQLARQVIARDPSTPMRAALERGCSR